MMFRLHKIKSDRLSLGERIDFKISHFKALQVPRGWDKLYVTVISVETGKTIARLSKSAVSTKNGCCEWNESLAESVWVSSDEPSKELEDCVFKFVVAMGSARSGILGEATVNMSSYMKSASSVLASFPLKKCKYGTVLQAKIQCLTPVVNLRDGDGERKPDQEFDSPFDNSPVSYSTSDTASTPLQADPETREASSSATNSPRSEDSEELPVVSLVGARNAASGVGYFSDSLNSGTDGQDGSLRIMDSSSQAMLEAAEETIEDLRGTGKMWERKARKLMLEIDFLKKENLELTRNQGDLGMEFSEACAERDGLRKEVERLKLMLVKANQKQPPLNDDHHQNEGAWELAKELEREISFQKQANGNLTLQLKKSQESNLELVAVLQDLEETLEKQKVEIEGLYDMESRFSELEDALEESLEKNRILMAQISENLQESENRLEVAMASKEAEIAELRTYRSEAEARILALENEKSWMELDLESVTRENEIASRCLNDLQNDLTMISSNVDTHVSVNKKRSSELERDKQALELCLLELRQENEDLSTHIVELETRLRSKSSENGLRICDLEKELKKKLIKDQTETDETVSAIEIQRLKLESEVKVTELSTQLDESKTETERLETTLQANEEEILNLQRWKCELEARISVIEEEKDLLEQKMEEIMIENDITTRCFSELQTELIVIGNSVDSHISSKEGLERQNQNLEQQLSRIVEENRELLTRITDLETQLRSKAASELVSLMRILEEKEEQLREAENKCSHLSQELDSVRNEMEVTVSEHSKELSERMSEIKLNTNNQLLEVDDGHQKNAEIQRLKEDLAAFEENHGMLESESRRSSCLLEDYKLSEEKFRTAINDHELKLTVSEYDRQIVKEEAMKLKTELLKLGPVHEQVLALKNELSRAKSEKENLESSLQSVTAECQMLESEKNSLLDIIAVLKKLVAELEEHKMHSVALEAKLKQTENELMAKEALWEHDEDELNKIREASKQLHKRIQELENEKEHCLERDRTLQEKLIQNQSINNIDQKEDDEHSERTNLNSSEIIQTERFESELDQTSNNNNNNNNSGEKPDLKRMEEEESQLEQELREIRERYLHMSLKYAEVEAQRGELVMRLRAATNARVSF